MLAPRSSYVVEYSRREISERSQPSIAFWESSQRSMHPNQLARLRRGCMEAHTCI